VQRRLLLLIGSCLTLGLVVALLAWFAYSPPPGSNRPEPYSFFAAGHTYGVPGANNEGVHPPFKSWFPEINAQGMDLGIFTGDVVNPSTPADWDEIDTDRRELGLPVHIAVGNHDVTDRELFVSRYGPTYYSFEHQGDLFVLLDSELDPGGIAGEQLAFLQDALKGTDARNVFVFVHKLIWVTEGTPYYELRGGLNKIQGYNFRNSFWTDIEPLFRDLEAQIYVVAGDVGVTWAMPLFYEQDGNVHFVASGMGGAEEENYLTFQVGQEGVKIQAQRLDGEPLHLGSIENYGLAHYLGD
jgi:hypothetical protein